MATGTVAWFAPDKGYGFVTPDDGGGAAFVHWSRIVPTGDDGPADRVLVEGERVEFAVSTGPQGREVRDVTPVSTPAAVA